MEWDLHGNAPGGVCIRVGVQDMHAYATAEPKSADARQCDDCCTTLRELAAFAFERCF
jgi:hypothetical protein